MKKIRINSPSFVNLKKAYKSLSVSLETPVKEARDLSGIIKEFEMVYELSWKVFKKKLLEDGIQTTGPKDVFTNAFRSNYIDQEDLWLQLIVDRNQAAHIYDETTAKKIVDRVRSNYFALIEGTFDLT